MLVALEDESSSYGVIYVRFMMCGGGGQRCVKGGDVNKACECLLLPAGRLSSLV